MRRGRSNGKRASRMIIGTESSHEHLVNHQFDTMLALHSPQQSPLPLTVTRLSDCMQVPTSEQQQHVAQRALMRWHCAVRDYALHALRKAQPTRLEPTDSRAQCHCGQRPSRAAGSSAVLSPQCRAVQRTAGGHARLCICFSLCVLAHTVGA